MRYQTIEKGNFKTHPKIHQNIYLKAKPDKPEHRIGVYNSFIGNIGYQSSSVTVFRSKAF